jgi:ABC-type bacteriocin/lantibiotic exporter with double-glycine peptidase domain
MARQKSHIDDLRRVSGRMAWTGTAYGVVQSTTMVLVSIVTLLVGGTAVAMGKMSLSSLAAYYFVLAQLGGSLNALWTAIPQIMSGADSLRKIATMQTAARLTPVGGAREHTVGGAVELKDLHFSYGDTPLLRGVNLMLQPGEKIAITGPNGIGKSTLAYLILGLHAPQRGEILIDGVPLFDLALDHYRRQVGVALQDALLFAGTIGDNVAYGEAPGALERATLFSGARSFIETLPHGHDTQIGAAGISLSGGQGQILGLARALRNRPKLLILDEPTNHLDDATVTRFFEDLDAVDYRPAVLVITHERAVAARFDRVYRLEDGCLSELPKSAPAKFRIIGSGDG